MEYGKKTETFELSFSVPQSVLSDFSPIEGFVYTFSTVLIISVVLGLIVLLFNLTIKHSSGVVASGAAVFMCMFVYMNPSNIMYYFSPLHWCSIFIADKNGVSAYPDVSWIITVLCIWFVLEIIALFIYSSKRIKFVLDTKEDIR